MYIEVMMLHHDSYDVHFYASSAEKIFKWRWEKFTTNADFNHIS